MGYNIQYGRTVEKSMICEVRGRNKNRIRLTCTIVLIAVMFLVYLCNIKKIRSFLLPGDSSVTEAAISCFIEDMQEGKPFCDAITAFCLEIINHASISG